MEESAIKETKESAWWMANQTNKELPQRQELGPPDTQALEKISSISTCQDSEKFYCRMDDEVSSSNTQV